MDEVEITNVNFSQTTSASNNPPALKRKRNLPGNPDPEAEVIALSPKTLMATNRFLCETCGKGFQRDQIFNYIDVDIIFHGSLSREQTKK